MLAIFVLCSCCNAMHWIQFSIISNVVTRYYSVSSSAINLTAVVFGACYVPFVLPASWLLSRYVSCARSKFLVREWRTKAQSMGLWIESAKSCGRGRGGGGYGIFWQLGVAITSRTGVQLGVTDGRFVGMPVPSCRRSGHCSTSLTEILISRLQGRTQGGGGSAGLQPPTHPKNEIQRTQIL
jgi:hypothetical protein